MTINFDDLYETPTPQNEPGEEAYSDDEYPDDAAASLIDMIPGRAARRAESRFGGEFTPPAPPPQKKRRLFVSKRDKAKAAETADLHRIQRSFQWGRTVLVTNEKGGTGKSVLSALIAAGYGHYHPTYPTILLENNPTGNLNLTLETPARRTFDDLIQAALSGLDVDPSGYAQQQAAGRFAALPSAKRREDNRDSLTRDQFDAGWELLNRYYKHIICDEGNNLHYESSQAALAKANAVVMPIRWTDKACDGAFGVLRELDNNVVGSILAQNVVLVETIADEFEAECRKSYLEALADPLRPTESEAASLPAGWGPVVVRIPYVPAWDSGSKPKIVWTELDEQMRVAIRRVCGEISTKIALLDEYSIYS
jgi:cellulose biosynthesis protein BcsQ